MEAQPVIIPRVKDSTDGYPVINITIKPNADPREIIINTYKQYRNSSDIAPIGIIFRTHFARSLSSDKREILSLKGERKGYFCVNEDNEICSLEFSDDGKKIMQVIDDNFDIERVAPPAPKLVFSSIKI
jgi:hypothetical protein